MNVNSLMHAKQASVFSLKNTEYLMVPLTIHVFLRQTGSHLRARAASPNKQLSV